MATDRLRRIIELLVIAAAYYTAGCLGQLVAIPPGNITAIWPPSGIALAAVLLRGNRVWPGIVLGAFFASAGAIFDSSTAASAARSLAVLSGICVGSTLQALLGAALIRFIIGSPRPFERSMDVFRFAAIEMLACLVSPTIGVLSMWLGNYIQGAVTGVTWTTWWLGDYTGVLLVTPALLVWRVRPRVRWSRAAEALLLFGMLVVWGWRVFHAGTGQLVLRPYTMIPLLIWAAFRFGRGGVMAAALTFSVIAVLGVIYGHGPFVGGTMNESLLALQAFVGVATVTGLAVAAAVEERRRAEVALREAYDDVERRVEERTAQLHASEERFSRSFHASPMGMSITRLADGQYIDVNEAFLSLFGYVREETLGHTSLQLQTWASPEDRDRFVKILREQGRVRNIEIQCRRKSGEIWTALVSAEVLEIAGERYVLALLQDITERKRMQEDLQVSERRYRRLFENAKDGILIIDGASGKIVDVNPFLVELLGYPKDEFLNKKLWEIGLFKDIVRSKESFLELQTKGYIRYDDLPLVTKDGPTIDVEFVSHVYQIHHETVIQCNVCEITERKRAEEALKESEDKFKYVFDNSTIGMSLTLPTGQINVNKAFCDMLGYSQQEFTNTKWQDITPPEDIDETQKLLDKLITGEKDSVRFIKRYLHKNGSIVWADISTALRRDKQGKPMYYITSVMDITERKRMQEDLQVSERRYRRLFENAKDGILIIDGASGKIVDVNPFLVELLGYPKDKFLNKKFWKIGLFKDIVRSMESFLELQTKGYMRYDDLPLATKDGFTIDVEFVSHVYQINQETIIQCNVREITERKRAEEALKESEEKFKYVFENSTIGMSLTLPSGQINVNKAFCDMLGYSQQEFTNTKWQDITPPEDIDETQKLLDKLITGEKDSVRFIKRYLHKNGSIVWADISTALRRDKQGKPMYYITSVMDITERKRAEEAIKKANEGLDRSNRELEQFAYVASHDLQEPLRMVSSYTQLLAQRYEGQLDEKAQKYINYAVDGAIRMQSIINDLLAFSCAGTRGKAPELTDLHSILGEALRNLTVMIEKNRAIITNDDLPTVRADASQLVQVFQNLIANAIKFRREDLPRIHVSARDDGREWIFSVRDNGIGIDPQYKNRLFVIFQRLHTRQEYPGIGIGLTVCKKIVEHHGGRIWFESEPGNGSTFFFTVPK